jgi:hypothetical protein
MPIGAVVLPEAILLAAKTVRLQLTSLLMSVLIRCRLQDAAIR